MAKNKSTKVARAGFPPCQNPCTSDIEYTPAEVEFANAVDKYKRKHHRTFPTNRELFYILLSLGYRKVDAPGDIDVESSLSRSHREELGKD